ncbi:MAG: MSMEG_0565 family glycosyltransferase [Acidimicrobiales bacterium]
MSRPTRPRVGLLTYSTKPRGGVVHTLALADHLAAAGVDAEVIALGDPAVGFFRPVAAPWRLIPKPPPAPTLERRVFAALDAMADGLRRLGPDLPPVLHAQDCISARAAVRLRDEGAPVTVVRTVHHVDDFTTEALIDCQRRAIVEPDRVLVVSATWRQIVLDDYGVAAEVVPNGVDRARFAARPNRATVARLRACAGADDDTFLLLAVGGIEPRKGSDHLVRAVARVGGLVDRRVMLAVIGGHSFQDHRWYRDRVLEGLPGLGLELGRDVVVLGTVDDEELPTWYHAADALAFPSVTEGWGLVVLEAMAAGLPVVATDIPVLREYVLPGRDALLVAPGDDAGLASAIARLAEDGDLRDGLAAAGRAVAARYDWSASADRHAAVYASVTAGDHARTVGG